MFVEDFQKLRADIGAFVELISRIEPKDRSSVVGHILKQATCEVENKLTLVGRKECKRSC